MDLTELLRNKKRGDIKVVAEILKISPKCAEMAFRRPGSKRHKAVVNQLETIITVRQMVIDDAHAYERLTY